MGALPPRPVIDLVERFERDLKVFLSPDHKEEQLRAEFPNPQFRVLDWGVANDTEPLETSRQMHIADGAKLSKRYI